MKIIKAEARDAGEILRLLSQVLEIHAAIRPDVFISGTTKYSEEDLIALLAEENRYSYAAKDENGALLGYALCVLREQRRAPHLVSFTALHVDDLCVDERVRGQGVGRALFEHVKSEAAKMGCYEVTLDVWEGNDTAKAFYGSMGMKPKETCMELILKQ